jgi:hypothetical protein
MNSWPFYDKVTGSIPFSLKGYNGKVSVYYGANEDPKKVGFDSLPGLNFEIDRCRGYPVMHARIDNYGGSGYRTFCGWIQIVTSIYFDSHDRKISNQETFVSMDVPPAFQELDIPFVSYGIMPQIFDSPCLNLGEYAELRWTADTFLTSIPTRSREEEVSWLLGFRWGYIENDMPGAKPILLPLEMTDPQVWNSFLPYLKEQYRSWKFKLA